MYKAILSILKYIQLHLMGLILHPGAVCQDSTLDVAGLSNIQTHGCYCCTEVYLK